MIMPAKNPMDELREEMVRTQIATRGIRDEKVLEAMRKVPREIFVPENLRREAFADHPLPIGHAQTISQPYIVALMTEMLEAAENAPLRILDVGTGSGYQAAVLAWLGHYVVSIERVRECAENAERDLGEAGLADSVEIHVGDGCDGYPQKAPFDRAVISAATPKPPEKILEQLKPGGILVAPIGSPHIQRLVKMRKRMDGAFEAEPGIQCRFVPLIGEDAF